MRGVESFKFSCDPQFEAKLADIVGLYLDPPRCALVLCVDEKSLIQALNRTQPALPMWRGLPVRMTQDYVRHGTTRLFAELEVARQGPRALLPAPSACRFHRLPEVAGQALSQAGAASDLRQLLNPQASR
jgi:hypothetical protein